MLLAGAAMVLSLVDGPVEVVVRLFVRWVLGVGCWVHLLSRVLSRVLSRARVLSRLSSWGDVFSRQNLVLQNE
jgi:hypothetical protein